jgi:Protein of unknown function (DUF3047)
MKLHFSFLRTAFSCCSFSCCLFLAALATGCANTSQRSADADTETTAQAKAPSETLEWAPGHRWRTFNLPSKKPTEFSKVTMDGRNAVMAVADASASLLRQQVRIPAAELSQVRFSWKVPQLIEAADLAQREGDDSPVRIVLTFEGNRANWSAKNAMLSELSLVLTGEELPYATLMYVWCNTRAPGSVIHNPRTDRIRTIVVESGPKNLNQWLDYERNIKADFERAFGEAPGALVGMALMTDTDNTRTQARAYYGPVSMRATAQPTALAAARP